MTFFILYLMSGLVAGFLAGLVGVGGGLVLVPILVVLFSVQGFYETIIMPLALGTSLATIIFTSVASAAAHHAKGAVNWGAVRDMLPGIAIGALASAAIAALMPPAILQLIFAVYAAIAATQLLCNLQPHAARALPGRAGLVAAGTVIGAVSALAGVGGAVTTIPFLQWCNVSVRTAVGTAAAVGLPVAASGTVGYVGLGWNTEALPPLCLGFVYLPALATIVVASMLMAPLGTSISHRLPVPALKKMLAGILYLVSLRSIIALA
jgi:uncharacterized membrane protein YfcA